MERKPIEIPGYFYDEKAKRYFKHTQGFQKPDDNRFTIANVKRRKTEEKEIERRGQCRRHAKGRVRRSKILAHPVTGGHLAGELFGPVCQATASLGSCSMPSSDLTTSSHLVVGGMPTMGRRPAVDRDMRVACWVGEFGQMGRLDMVPKADKKKSLPNVPVFMVGGYDYKMGMGTVYATMNRDNLYAAYLPFDESNRLDFSKDTKLTVATQPGTVLVDEAIRCPHISSITYHEPSNRVLLTSRKAEPNTTIYIFNPVQSLPAENRPFWLLGETDHYRSVSLHRSLGDADYWWSNCAAAAPASSSLVAAIGTNVGITTFTQSETVSWLTSPSDEANIGEVLSVDFLPSNPDILLAGGRRGHMLLADMRLPTANFEYSALVHTAPDVLAQYSKKKHQKTQTGRWGRQGTAASIAHAKALNEHQVLVAGIRNSMAVYDLRWRKSNNWAHMTSCPIASFAGYRNDVHLDIGLALSADGHMVAAAHDDGTVAVYSTRSGRRLRCPPVDKVRGSQNTPIRCLQWATMPNEHSESLWIGAGPSVLGVGLCGPLGGGEEYDEC